MSMINIKNINDDITSKYNLTRRTWLKAAGISLLSSFLLGPLNCTDPIKKVTNIFASEEITQQDKIVIANTMQHFQKYIKNYANHIKNDKSFWDKNWREITEIVGLNPVPQHSVLENQAIVAETSAYLLFLAMQFKQYDLAWEIISGINQVQRIKLFRNLNHIVSYGLFADSITTDCAEGITREGFRGKDLNPASDADLKIVRFYIEMLEYKLQDKTYQGWKAEYTAYQNGKAHLATPENIKENFLNLQKDIHFLEAQIDFHLNAIANKDINIYRHRPAGQKENVFYVLKPSGGYKTSLFNMSYEDWIAYDKYIEFSIYQKEKYAWKAGVKTNLDKNNILTKLKSLLPNSAQKTELIKLIENKEDQFIMREVIHRPEAMQLAEREELIKQIYNSMTSPKNQAMFFQLMEMLKAEENIAFWQKVKEDATTIVSKIIEWKIQKQIENKLIGSSQSILRANLEEISQQIDKGKFWETYFDTDNSEGLKHLMSTLRKAGIEDLGTTLVNISFQNGQLGISKTNETEFQGNIEAPRFIINLAEYYKHLTENKNIKDKYNIRIKNYLNFFAQYFENKDFYRDIKTQLNQGLYLDVGRTSNNLFAAAAASIAGSEKTIKKYQKQLETFNTDYDLAEEFLTNDKLYFHQSLYYWMIGILYKDELNTNLNKKIMHKELPKLTPSKSSDNKANKFRSIDDFLAQLPRKYMGFLLGEFATSATQRYREVLAQGDYVIPTMQRNNSLAEEQTSIGNQPNAALSATICVLGQTTYSKYNKDVFETDRAVKSLQAAFEQTGVELEEQIYIVENIIRNTYESEFFASVIRDLFREYTDPGKRRKKIQEVLHKRVGYDSVIESWDHEEYAYLMKVYDQLAKEKNISTEEFAKRFTLAFKFDNRDLVPLRILQLELYKQGGEEYVDKLRPTLDAIYAAFKKGIKVTKEEDLKSFHKRLDIPNYVPNAYNKIFNIDPEAFPREKYFLDIMKEELWINKEIIPELNNTLDESIVCLINLAGLEVKQELNSLGILPKIKNERINQKRIEKTVSKLEDILPTIESGRDAGKTKIPTEMRHRVYIILAGMIYAKGVRENNISLIKKAQKINMLALQNLVKHKKHEQDTHLETMALEIIDRLVYSHVAIGDIYFQDINMVMTKDDKKNIEIINKNNEKIILADQAYQRAAKFMDFLYSKTKSFRILKLLLSFTSTEQEDVEKNSTEPLAAALNFVSGLFQRGKFAGEDFALKWKYNRATLNFKFADALKFKTNLGKIYKDTFEEMEEKTDKIYKALIKEKYIKKYKTKDGEIFEIIKRFTNQSLQNFAKNLGLNEKDAQLFWAIWSKSRSADNTPTYLKWAKLYSETLKTMQEIKLFAKTITGSVRPAIILHDSTLIEIIARQKLALCAAKLEKDKKLSRAFFATAFNLGISTTFLPNSPVHGFKKIRVSPVDKEGKAKYIDLLTNKDREISIINNTRDEIVELNNVSNGVTLLIEKNVLSEIDTGLEKIPYLQNLLSKTLPNHGYLDDNLKNINIQKKEKTKILKEIERKDVNVSYYHHNRISIITSPDIVIQSIVVEKSSLNRYFGLAADRYGMIPAEVKLTIKTNKGTIVETIDEEKSRGTEGHRIVLIGEEDDIANVYVDEEIDKIIKKENASTSALSYLPQYFGFELNENDKENLIEKYGQAAVITPADIIRNARIAKLLPDYETGETTTFYQIIEKKLGTWSNFISELTLWTDVDEVFADDPGGKLKMFIQLSQFLQEALCKAPDDFMLRLAHAKTATILTSLLQPKDEYKNKEKTELSSIHAEFAKEYYKNEIDKYLSQKLKAKQKVRNFWEAEACFWYAKVLYNQPYRNAKDIVKADKLIDKLCDYLIFKSTGGQADRNSKEAGTLLSDRKDKALALKLVNEYFDSISTYHNQSETRKKTALALAGALLGFNDPLPAGASAKLRKLYKLFKNNYAQEKNRIYNPDSRILANLDTETKHLVYKYRKLSRKHGEK